MNTRRGARRVLTRAGLQEEELVTVEAEPSYLVFSTPSFLLGVAYERLVNRISSLAGFRACLFGCFRKDRAAPGVPLLAESRPGSGGLRVEPGRARSRMPGNRGSA
jgi:hypothetical protein